MIKIDTSELDKFQKKLEQVHGTHEVSSDDLMTDEFIRSETSFDNWQQVMNAGDIKSSDGLEGEAFSDFIRSNTKFESFEDMLNAAGQQFLLKKLEL